MKISISNIRGVLKVVAYKVKYGKRLSLDFTKSKKPIYFGKGSKIIIGKDSKLKVSGGSYFSDYTYLSVQDGGVCTIEEDVYMNTFSKIYCINEIRVDRGCIFGSNISIYDHNHNIDRKIQINKSGMKIGKVKIESEVWVGTNSVILMDSNISCGSVIGANSVLSKSANIRGVYCGIPAKLIKKIE